jgi:2-polyprenyl-6-methoxyphenol hydroxylase-like FAD-dependent oxidoreductase
MFSQIGPLPYSTDVFIVGGGPSGLAAAIAARRRGFEVVVADATAADKVPIDKACGEGIMPDGLAAARALGIEISPDAGHEFPGIRFWQGAESVEARFAHGSGLGVRRTTLHRLLLDQAADAGVHLAWGTPISNIDAQGVIAAGCLVRARWIIGADGAASRVRRWAGLESSLWHGRRFGFRRHYRESRADDYMELHWGDGCQLYLTPIAAQEVCLVLISRNPRLRIDEALNRFPEVAARLEQAEPASVEKGAVTATRRLRQVWRGNVALVGDASGSVDAATGEGLCLLFRQAAALADALAEGDLRGYQAAHRHSARRPELMGRLLLVLDRYRTVRHSALAAMFAQPRIFAALLAAHVGRGPALPICSPQL